MESLLGFGFMASTIGSVIFIIQQMFIYGALCIALMWFLDSIIEKQSR